MTTRCTWRAALFVVACDVSANRSATAQLRALVRARSTTNFGANGRKSGSGSNALENKRSRIDVGVIDPNSVLVHRLPLSVRFAATTENAAGQQGAIRTFTTGECHRCKHCRRRNQAGCSGENQATGVTNSSERHVSTARRPTRSSVLGTFDPFASPTGCCRMIRTFQLRNGVLPTGLLVNLLRARIGVEPKSVRSS